MNKQGKVINGKVVGGIEWTKTVLPDGSERQGYTWNPISGCKHACQWQMPDGTIANCYAEDSAENVRMQPYYPQGFEHHYWNPERLTEPASAKTPAKIFVGSMADVFGHWVPADQIEAVLAVANDAPWHTYQFLTKNPVRAADFDIPRNAWIGASTPPDFMWNKRLSGNQQRRLLTRTLDTLRTLKACGVTTWMSAEPLSWDVSAFVDENPALDWIVIGAASNGRTYYPPEESHVRSLIDVCDRYGIAVFFKGNMRSLPWARDHWRESFPTAVTA